MAQMTRYIAVRLVEGLVVVGLVTTLVFGVLHLARGDPVLLLVGAAPITNEQLEYVRHFWGLDRPLLVQYLTWIANLLRGDFGTSIAFGGRPVWTLVLEAAAATLLLAVFALALAMLLAIPAGLLAAVNRGSAFDGALLVSTTMGAAVPSFWLGLVLIAAFSLRLGWVPPFGRTDWTSYVLPIVVLAAEPVAVMARLTRATTLEVLNQEYVLTARAKGLGGVPLALGHIAGNALLPVATTVGYRVGLLLSGAVVVETIFGWPGMGRLLLQAIVLRDLALVLAIAFLNAMLVVFASLVTDVVCASLDPRVRCV
jgi:ABC-type dipeptide/oligopeptide/nickel transport system permease component